MKLHLDPASLTVADIMKKLQKEDAAKFREVMQDLSYEGKDPNWHNIDILDQLQQIKGLEPGKGGKKDDLKEIRSKLKREKEELVKELVRTQGLLSATVELDKDQAALNQAHITSL